VGLGLCPGLILNMGTPSLVPLLTLIIVILIIIIILLLLLINYLILSREHRLPNSHSITILIPLVGVSGALNIRRIENDLLMVGISNGTTPVLYYGHVVEGTNVKVTRKK